MSKVFNVSADCKPNLHYMVDISNRLREIKVLIDKGEYFTMNRARQYGKTTTLRELCKYLKDEYLVVSLDFQTQMSGAKFRNENIFSIAFAKAFVRAVKSLNLNMSEELSEKLEELGKTASNSLPDFELVELFQYLSDICAASCKPVVLIVDEVDSAANNQVFLDFLAQLRGYFIDRDQTPTFRSVILAGVYDVKNLKRKLRPEDAHKMNSPWNIAADFNVVMEFSTEDICGMLTDYEEDHQTGMNIVEIAQMLYDYTSGYPFLVSRLCKLIDEVVAGSTEYPGKKEAWTIAGLRQAVKLLLMEKNTLFESLTGKLNDYPELQEIILGILFEGRSISFNLLNPIIEIAAMFGLIKNQDGNVVITNRIFETIFYNLYLTSTKEQEKDICKAALQDKNQFIQQGRLNMELVLEKFVLHFDELYGDRPDTFKEEDGRRYFLLYLRPIINGVGNYYIEARTRNMERTDVIVDYSGEQFVIEMKIWRGNAYHQRGEEQLGEYLEHYHLNKGYMLSFNFNNNKEVGVKRIVLGDKELVEAVV